MFSLPAPRSSSHFSSRLDSSHSASRLGLPALSGRLSELRHTLWVPAWLLCFAILERLPRQAYWDTALPPDRWIPFCSGFLIPYLLWYVLMALAGLYALVRNRNAFRHYMDFLSFVFFASVLLWIFFPNRQTLRPASPDGVFGPAVVWLYRADTDTNVFPSGHVAGSVGMVLAVWEASDGRNVPEKERRRLRAGMLFAAALVILSTLFLKQHSLLDVAGGLLFSALGGGWVSLWAALARTPRRGYSPES